MKTITIILAAMILASCGTKNEQGDSAPVSDTSRLELQLTTEEKELVDQFEVDTKITEKAMLKRILKLKQLDEAGLNRLNEHLLVQCQDGNCEVSKKERK